MRSTPRTATGHGTAAGLEDRFGPLTEVSGLRRQIETFRTIAPALPRSAAVEPPITPQRQKAAERHRQRGWRAANRGKPAAAIAAFRDALRFDPRNAEAHQDLGFLLLELGHLDEAVEHLRLATVLHDDALAWHNLGVALRRQHRDDEAVAAYRRAIELDPGLVVAHTDLAALLEELDEEAAAAQLLRRAAALLPAGAAALLLLARALILDSDFAGAETRLREAMALDPANDEVLSQLGDVLARQGRFDEALPVLDHALSVNPRNGSAYFAAAEIKKHREPDRPRLARVLAALADSGLSADSRVSLHFAAGKICDDLGEYERAMHHFDAANRIKGRDTRFDADSFAAEVDRLIARFTKEFFAAGHAFAVPDETPLLIVGLPRSGTTLVEQILTRHPGIGGGGEQSFWIKHSRTPGIAAAAHLAPPAAQALARDYLTLLHGLAPQAMRVTDKLPFNVLCLGLIHLLLPKARIIQCRRHPVDTCLSIYFTHFRKGVAFANDKGALALAYRQYGRLMDHWRAVLPEERFIEIAYEDLIRDREAVTRKMIAFAGLEWSDACLSPEHNPRPVITASLWQARQPVYASSIARWRHYRPWLGELAALLSAAERASGDDQDATDPRIPASGDRTEPRHSAAPR